MITSVDLFSGIGGWSLAAEAAGITTVAAAEADAWKRSQYAYHFPAVRLYEDVRQVSRRQFDNDGIGSIDLVLGSPPCTDVSAANHRGAGIDGDESGLIMDAVRIIDELRPRGVALENSPRFRTRGIDRVLVAMDRIGYVCWPLVVGAIHAGAPHIRQRMWLVAADAERLRLRHEQGRRGRPDRLGPAEPAYDADTDREGQSRLSFDAEMGGRAGVDETARGIARISSDTDECRREGAIGPRRRHVGTSEAEAVGVDPNPNRLTRRPRARGQNRAETGDGRDATPCHSDRARLAEWQGVAGDHGQQISTAERATHGGWGDPAQSLARHLRVDDGISSWLAADCRSAYGDAIVPQVATAILRSMRSADII